MNLSTFSSLLLRRRSSDISRTRWFLLLGVMVMLSPSVTIALVSGGADSIFASKVDVATGSFPWSTTAADFNGDGKVDLAATIYDSNSVEVFRNIGSAGSLSAESFAARATFTTGAGPTGVASGDFNRDGKADLAISNAVTGTVSILRNTSITGEIQFATRMDVTVGKDPKGLVVWDFDDDGMLDIAVPNEGDSSISILHNTSSVGSISFLVVAVIKVGVAPLNAAVGDLDGDGRADLTAVNNGSGTIALLMNTSSTGSISFAAPLYLQTGLAPGRMAVADIDGDDLPELIVGNINSGTIAILHNLSRLGSFAFAPPLVIAAGTKPWAVAAGDFDGDDRPDISVTNYDDGTVTIFINKSQGGWYTPISLQNIGALQTGSNPLNVQVQDLDSDGNPDLIVACRTTNTLSLFRNSTNAVAIPAAPFPRSPWGGAVNQPTTVRLGWTKARQATSYRLQVSVDSLFASTVFDDSTIINNSKLIGSLSYLQKYFWRVAARNSLGSSSFSDTWWFTTVGFVPEAPVALAATDMSTSAFTANWLAAAGAMRYRFDVATDPAFSSFLSGYYQHDAGAGTSHTVTGLIPNTSYFYRVRAEGSGGTSASSDIISVNTLLPAGVWSMNLTVADSAGHSSTLSFGLAPSATDGLDSVLGEIGLPPSPPASVFDARFVGNDIGIDLGQGTMQDFRQGDSTSVDTCFYEVAYQAAGESMITLSWNLPARVEGRLQDVTTGTIIDTLMRGRGSFVVANPGAIAKLKMTIYYGVTVVSVRGMEARVQMCDLGQNFPNPFNPVTAIRYTIAGTGDAGRGATKTRLVVYDVLGREVAVLVNEPKLPGTYEVTFSAKGGSASGGDGSQLPSGVYFYRLTAGTFTQSRKMLLLK